MAPSPISFSVTEWLAPILTGNGGSLPILSVTECLAPILIGNGGSPPKFNVTDCLASILTGNGGSPPILSVIDCLAPILTGNGGCWYLAVDTLSSLGTHFILYLRLSSLRGLRMTGYGPD